MALTPLDIHNKEFKRVFRGYSEEEVDDFLDKVVKEYEALYKENAELKEHLEKKEGNIVKYKEIEETIKNTLLVAQQTAQDVKNNSEKEGELILKKAKNEAEALYSEAQREAERLVYQAKNEAHDTVTEANDQIKKLTDRYEKLIVDYQKFQAQFKAMLQSQLELLQWGEEPLKKVELKEDSQDEVKYAEEIDLDYGDSVYTSYEERNND